MKLSTIYKRAAQTMERSPAHSSYGACSAIEDSRRAGALQNRAKQDMVALYRQDARAAGGVYHSYWGMNFSESGDAVEARDCRVLMLGFMAAIAERKEKRRAAYVASKARAR